jgi:hypothetical protein
MLKEAMAKAQIVGVLQGYTYDINRIFALIPQGSRGVKEAQSRVRQLKNAMHSDYKQRHAIARNTQLTPIEQKNLAGTISDVFFALQAIGVNSNPSTEWRNALFAADMDIQRCVARLNGLEERAESVTTD